MSEIKPISVVYFKLMSDTLEEKVEYYFSWFLKQGKDYPKNKLREALQNSLARIHRNRFYSRNGNG